jgi:TP901 family phage tail tape measure protein
MAFSGGVVAAQLILRSNFSKVIAEAVVDLDVLRKQLEKVADTSKQIGAVWTKNVTVPVATSTAALAKAAIDFESSFAGIKKTVGGVTDEFGALNARGLTLRQGMRDLAKEIPISVHELNAIGETAGSLGLAEDKIVGFTKVMASLGVTTDLTTQAATEGIAKIQNIYKSAGVDTDRFAATLVALGNEGASTESAILSMAGRIAGTGQVVGVTQAQVLGLSSALASVDIEAEMGGTAISRVMIEMANAVEQNSAKVGEFARVSGVSTKQFVENWKTDAAGAIGQFIVGLKDLQAAGGSVFQTLEDLNFGEIRVRDTLLRAMGASNLFTQALKTANEAWRENAALAREAEQRFKTVASQLRILWNRIYDVGITLGDTLIPTLRGVMAIVSAMITVVEKAAMAYASLPGIVHVLVNAVLLLVASIGPLLLAFGVLLSSALALAGTLYGLRVAWAVLTGGVVQAPAILRAAALGLDHLAGLTFSSGTVTFRFATAVDTASAAVGRGATALAVYTRAKWAAFTATSGGSTVMGLFGAAVDKVGGAFSRIGGAVGGFVTSIRVGTSPTVIFTNTLNSATAAVGGWGTKLTSGLTSAFASFTSGLTSVGGFVTRVFTGIGSVVGWAARMLVGGFGLIRAAITGLIGLLGWPVTLGLALAYLVSLIPGVRGLIGDIVQICILWARIIIDQLIKGLKWLIGVVVDAAKAVGNFLKDLIADVPGMGKVAEMWGRITKGVRDYKNELARQVDGDQTMTEELQRLIGGSLPNAPKPGKPKPGTITPLEGLPALALDLGFTGDMSNVAGMELLVLAKSMETTRAAAAKLSPEVKAYIAAANGIVDKDKIVEVLVKHGMEATMAASAVDVYTEQLAKMKQESTEAAREQEQLREKIRDLAKEMSGAAALEKADQMFQALELSGMNVPQVMARAVAQGNKTVLASMAEIHETATAAIDVFHAKGQAVPLKLAIIADQTRNVAEETKAWQENVKSLRDIVQPFYDAIRDRTKDLTEKGRALMVSYTGAWKDNQKAIFESKRAIEDYKAAANALPFATLGAQLDAVAVKWKRLHEDMERDANAKVAAGEADPRLALQWQERINTLVREQAAEMRAVEVEWIRSLPLPEKMAREFKKIELAEAKAELAFWLLRKAWGDPAAGEAIARLALKIQQLEGELTFGPWIKGFENVARLAGAFGDAFTAAGAAIGGTAGYILAAIGQITKALEGAATNMRAFLDARSKGDLIGQISAIGQGVTQLWAATGTANKAGNLGAGAMQGGMTGAQIGMMVGGPIGAGIGLAIGMAGGLVLAAIRNNAEWHKVGKDIGRDWGVSISEELAKEIAKVSKQIGRQDAPLFFMDKIFAEAGGIASFGVDNAITKVRQLFSAIERGTMTTQQAGQMMGRVFKELADEATKAGGIASKQFLELIALERRFGLGTKEVKEFLSAQITSFGEGARKRVDAFFKMFDLDRMQKAREELAKFDEKSDGDARDRLKLQEELNAAQAEWLKKFGADAKVTAFFGGVEKRAKAMNDAIADPKAFRKWAESVGIAATLVDEVLSGSSDTVKRAMEEFWQNYYLNTVGGLEQITAEFERQGMYAGITFFETLKTQGFDAAMEAAGPMFDQLKKLSKELGFELTGVGALFGHIYDSAAANPETMQALSGLQQMIVGAGNAMILNQPLMDAFSADAAALHQRLIDAGTDGDTALLLMQPTLQALWEAQDRFGLAVDDGTQALIDQAVQQGIVGEQGRNIHERILGVLERIAVALGADIPDAFDQAARAGEDAGRRIGDALDIPDVEVNVDVNHRRHDFDGDGPEPDPTPVATGGRVSYGKILRFAQGGWVPMGTDTVPAMLTPGEVVLNAGQQKNLASQLAMQELVAKSQDRGRDDAAQLAQAFAQALRESGAGEAGIVVVNAGKAADAFDQVVANLPRSVRQNKRGIRTELREALGIAS